MALLRQNSSWQQWQQETSKNTNFHATGDPLAIIYNEGVWRLNKVSPLYNMRYLPVKLKMYAAKVRQAIVSAVQASSAKYTVTFNELPNLKYSEDDASGLMLTVSSTIESNTKSKVAYVAILLSWGVSENVDKATHLPYLLERGEQRVGTSVKSTLQILFDCNIMQFTFTQHQLLQFGFSFVDSDTSRSTDPFTLIYKTPQIDHKEKLNLSFDFRDVNIIWNGVKDGSTNYSDLVNLAYQMLQNQIFHSIMLDITVFDLSEVNLPKAEIKSNGAVKMKTPEIVNCVFTVLNKISTMKSKENVNTIIEE